MKSPHLRYSLLISAAAGGLLASSASAQTASAPSQDTGQLQEIVVTAQKRAENLQKVPVAVSAFNAMALAKANIRDAADLGKLTPGLVITHGDRNLTPYLRGVGSDVNPIGFESSVAVYIDGVYYPRLSPGFLNLSDVSRVEVLKGPQGTLFGRNASAGLINIITEDPKLGVATGKFSVGYSNYATDNIDSYVSLPLGSKAALSFTESYAHQGDGYGKNVVTGDKANFQNDLTLRSKLLVQPSDRTKIIVSGFFLKSLTDGLGNTYPGTTQGYTTPPFQALGPLGFYDKRGNRDEIIRSKSDGGSVRIQQDLDFATISSISSYQYVREYGTSDNDYTNRDEFNGKVDSTVKTVSQELQLASPSTGAFKWTAGLYFFQSKAAYKPFSFGGILFGEGTNIYGEQNSRSYAAYAQGSLKLTDKLNLTLGGRYTHDDISANGRIDGIVGGTVVPFVPQASASTKDDRFTFRAALDYQITRDAMVYASFNRGYKAGTFAILPFSPDAARPEVLDAYEVGFKTEFLNHRVRLNGSAFYYDIKNPQIQIIQAGSAFVSNAKSAHVKGAELQLEVAPVTGLTVDLSGTYLDPRYKSFTNAAAFFPNLNTNPALGYIGGTLPATTIDASGERMIHAPKVQFAASVNYSTETPAGAVDLSADYAYTGNFYWQPDHVLKQKAYGLLGARARLALTHDVGISIYGKNLTNRKYVAAVIEQAGAAGYPYIPGAPRTYGGTIDFKF